MMWKLDLGEGRVLGPWQGTKAVARRAALDALGRNGRLPRGSRLVRYGPSRKSTPSVPPYRFVARSPEWYNVVDGTDRVIAALADESQARELARLWNAAGRSFSVFSRYAQEVL